MYFLYNSIRSKIELEEQITVVERSVIEKLKMIRAAEEAYQAVHGQYTSDWDKLVNFVDTGKIYITQRTEEIITLPYGRDSVIIHIDTLRSVGVQDSLFKEREYPNFRAERLPFIPGSGGKKFDIFADKIQRGNVTVDVIEVKDVDPINPARSESNKAANRRPLRFGSRTDITVAGNWE
jgi:hypothetical protein